MDNGNQAGKGPAIASLVLGIVAIVFCVFGGWLFWGSVIAVICGIVGIICANVSKNAGFEGGLRTGGLVCSIIGLVGGAIVFVGCVLCVGALGTAGALSSSMPICFF